MSALALAALAVAQDELAKGVRGGRPGWGRFRGLEVDASPRIPSCSRRWGRNLP